MVSPASTRPLVLTSTGVPAVLVSAMVATRSACVAVESVFDVTSALAGERPLTVAVLVTEPASTSAWVIV
ncbi:hypothetical protein GCM10009593_29420 [Microlunatus antarcticus]